MGLDVYLYRYDNKEESWARSEKAEAEVEALWASSGKYSELSEPQKAEITVKQQEIYRQYGLDETWGEIKERQRIQISSTKYPDHYFNLGYFWSSYNEAGFNRVMDNIAGVDLYDFFEPGGEYCFRPDWVKARERAVAALEVFRKGNQYNVLATSSPIEAVGNEKEALRVFREELEKHGGGTIDYNYTNLHGDFFIGSPKKILAAIPGDRYGLPCTYLIYSGEFNWYEQALEIVIEACEWVLEQPDTDKFWLHWSA